MQCVAVHHCLLKPTDSEAVVLIAFAARCRDGGLAISLLKMRQNAISFTQALLQ